MRAPLVPGVLALAAGIALGAQRSVSVGGGPLLIVVALLAAGVGAYLARPGNRAAATEAPVEAAGTGKARGGGRAARGRDGRPVLVLLAVAGALLGVATRTGIDRSCAAWLPADVPLTVHGRVLHRTGDRVRLDLAAVEVGGVRVRCVEEVNGRIDEAVDTEMEGPAGAGRANRVVGQGRWWRPPGGSGLRPAGLLLLDRLGPAPGDAARQRWGLAEASERLRAGARRRVDRLFGRRAPLAASLLLAQRDGLDPAVRDRFARAGLSHLLAISGLHVGLVAGILLLLGGAARLGKGKAAAFAVAGTAAYVAFLGAPHSAARASLQIGLVLGARTVQRPARAEALMAAAALAILAVDPGALFSPGFQLSFAGVAGILVLRRPLLRELGPLAKARAGRAPLGRWLADGVATSVAATLATAPIVAWHFGRVAPIGIVANLVAIPLLAMAVPALALALAAGVLWVPAGRFIAGGGVALLDGLDATARAAAGVPGGTVPVPGSVALLLTAAAAAGYLATRRLGRTRRRVRAGVWAGAMAAVLLVAPVRPSVDRVEIHVIDVGQGDAIALRSPAGRWLLVDAGVATDRYDAGQRVVVPYLARRGVRRLEGLILTHPDADHTGGAAAVMEALHPRWVADPGMLAGKTGYLELLRLAAADGIPWVAARRGTELELDGMAVEFLHPADVVSSEDANDGSVVMRVVFGEFEALLTGDAPAAVELALVRRYGRRLEADVLKVGHHGSSTSTTPELLQATGVRLALISAGRGNRYGHPHRVVLDRLRAAGVAIARTDRQGTLVVRGTRAGDVSIDPAVGR